MTDVGRLRGAMVLAIGDLMLDEYVWGEVARISPEAPVPVVNVRRRSHAPGGAANVAAGVVALGGRALVGGAVGDDAAVRRLKGDGRPLVPAEERARLVAALRPVDHVVVFDEDTPEAVLDRVRPDVHCKGADYAPPDGKAIPEQAVVEGYGGRVAFLPLVPQRSTTELVEAIRRGDA